MDESFSRPGLERTLRALASAARPHPTESEEYAVIALAARALLFLHSRDELEDFYGWLESREAGNGLSSPVQAFSSMREALGWLEVQPEATQGSLVEVEHETYVIALGPTGSFVLVRTVTHHAAVGG
ncbi:hypothetical protein [Archangium lansingense]|uniref:Uncharacterized protein n=1 Tax=Archangium lansingense TaxID=2995310 RepID=A0ABT4ALK9_9BACT|nr:hypothetical protein [Archangium lansinium]MCY1082565.1 hypothetical protein [Archangium lansinium]